MVTPLTFVVFVTVTPKVKLSCVNSSNGGRLFVSLKSVA